MLAVLPIWDLVATKHGWLLLGICIAIIAFFAHKAYAAYEEVLASTTFHEVTKRFDIVDAPYIFAVIAPIAFVAFGIAVFLTQASRAVASEQTPAE